MSVQQQKNYTSMHRANFRMLICLLFFIAATTHTLLRLTDTQTLIFTYTLKYAETHAQNTYI